MRLASRLSSRPTPTTASPTGCRADPLRRVGRVADAAHDRRACLQRSGTGAEQDVEGAAVLGDRRRLHVARRDVVRVLDVFAAGRDVAAARHVVHDVADRGLDARTGEQLLRVVGEGLAGEVVRERGELVAEHVVGGGVHAELARTAGELLDLVDVLDGLAVLVDPLHRIGLQRELVLDDDPGHEDPDARDREQHGCPRRDAAEPDDQSAERTGAEVATLGGRLELADAEDGQREDDRADADRGDADREQESEVADHRHLGEVERGEREDGVERDDEQRGTEVARRLLDRDVRRGRSPPLPRRVRASGSRSRSRCRASPGAPRSSRW